MVLLAKNYEGYQNLVKLTSKAFTEGFYYKPRIDKQLLAEYSKGLIGLSACLSGIPPSLLLRGQIEEAKTSVDEFVNILGRGNYFLELQNHGLEPQLRVNPMLVDLAKTMNVPLVATNDAHYLKPDDARAHEILLCIGSGKTMHDPNRLRYGSDKFYVRSPEEMWNLFGDEHPEALRNTLAIAEMCELKLPSGVNHVPIYPIPESFAELTIDEYFERVVREGYEERRRTVWDAQLEAGSLRHALGVYQERISTELAMIKRMGFASYFLIVWDIVRYARQNNIPVGPGRGSAAGSLIAYCLGITDVDPIQYELLFERFLNPERVSMPDILTSRSSRCEPSRVLTA
jgi:DNA polymerase-3 subunit alpha